MSFNEDWRKYKLSDVLTIIGGGTPKTKVDEYWNGDIPWLSVKDFNNDYKTVYETEKTITELGLKNSSTKMLDKGDLIISARGTVGEIAQLGKQMAFNQSCYGLRSNEKTINDFLYYLLKYKLNIIKKNTHGSVFDTITKDIFDVLDVKIPVNIEEQNAIADILADLDKKIEINNKMNKILEEIAQAIYKYWFIDFEPFHDKNIIKKAKLKGIVDITLGNSPKSSTYNKDGIGFPLLNGASDFINGNPTCGRYSSRPNRIANKGEILLCTRGTIGNVSFADRDYCIGRGVSSLKPKKKNYKEYIYYTIKFHLKRLTKEAAGSVIKGLTKSDMLNIPIINLNEEKIMDRFHRLTKPITVKQLTIIEQNQTLKQLRDTLLPKLMSGEIRVSLKELEEVK